MSRPSSRRARRRGRAPRGGRQQDPTRQTLSGLGDYGTVVWMHPGFTERKASGSPFASIGCLTARKEDLDNLDGENYKDTTLIMQLLKDNQMLWTEDGAMDALGHA